MKVSVLQMGLCLGDFSANLDTLHRLAEEAMKERPDALLLPELWNLGFYPKPIGTHAKNTEEKSLSVLSELAASCQVNLVGGSIASYGKEGIRNTCPVFDRRGNLLASYDKVHLFSPMGEQKDFLPGNHLAIFSLDGVSCAVVICYDIRFPEFIRRLALEGISILFLPAEWPVERLIHWRTLLRARAIENQIFLVAANGAGKFPKGMHLGGHSLIIDPWGEILAEAGEEETILHAALQPAIRQKIKETIDVFADRRPEIDFIR